MTLLFILCLILLVACCLTSDTIGYMLFFPPAVMIAVIMLYVLYEKLVRIEKKLDSQSAYRADSLSDDSIADAANGQHTVLHADDLGERAAEPHTDG